METEDSAKFMMAFGINMVIDVLMLLKSDIVTKT